MFNKDPIKNIEDLRISEAIYYEGFYYPISGDTKKLFLRMLNVAEHIRFETEGWDIHGPEHARWFNVHNEAKPNYVTIGPLFLRLHRYPASNVKIPKEEWVNFKFHIKTGGKETEGFSFVITRNSSHWKRLMRIISTPWEMQETRTVKEKIKEKVKKALPHVAPDHVK